MGFWNWFPHPHWYSNGQQRGMIFLHSISFRTGDVPFSHWQLCCFGHLLKMLCSEVVCAHYLTFRKGRPWPCRWKPSTGPAASGITMRIGCLCVVQIVLLDVLQDRVWGQKLSWLALHTRGMPRLLVVVPSPPNTKLESRSYVQHFVRIDDCTPYKGVSCDILLQKEANFVAKRISLYGVQGEAMGTNVLTLCMSSRNLEELISFTTGSSTQTILSSYFCRSWWLLRASWRLDVFL